MQAVSLQHMDGTVQLTITDASLGQPQYFVFIYPRSFDCRLGRPDCVPFRGKNPQRGDIAINRGGSRPGIRSRLPASI